MAWHGGLTDTVEKVLLIICRSLCEYNKTIIAIHDTIYVDTFVFRFQSVPDSEALGQERFQAAMKDGIILCK